MQTPTHDHVRTHTYIHTHNLIVPPEILVPSIVSVILTQDLTGLESSVRRAQVGQTVLILEGFDVLIDCIIERGYPQPEVSWSKDNHHLHNDSTFTIFRNNSLLIHDVNAEVNEGEYTCLAVTPNIGTTEVTTSLDVISTYVSTSLILQRPTKNILIMCYYSYSFYSDIIK